MFKKKGSDIEITKDKFLPSVRMGFLIIRTVINDEY